MKKSTRIISAELIVKATEAIIDARNYIYKDCAADVSIKVTTDENERYTCINLKGFKAAMVAINLESIIGVTFEVKINSNDDVDISIYKL